MDYHRALYKNQGIDRKNSVKNVISDVIKKSRADKRMNLLDSKRMIAELTTETSEVTDVPPKVNSRVEMLAKWKTQKQKAMLELKKKQKPVFKVGILQRKATGSPLLKMTRTYADKNFLNPQQIKKVNKVTDSLNIGIVTRAKAKALISQNNSEKATELGKIVNNKRRQIKNHPFTVPESVSQLASKLKVTIPQSPQVLKRGRESRRRKAENPASAPKVLPEKQIPNTENEEENINECVSNKEEKDVKENVSPTMKNNTETSADFVPIYYVPFVNKFRGSEIKSPRKIKMLDVDELIQEEENEFKCRIFSFRKYIECQTKRLLDLCKKWRNTTKGDLNIPDDVKEELLSLYGKTTLLTTDKFMQFQDLINKCEQKDPMIKVSDLQGYQDWVAIEVEGLDQAFVKLEERKAKNWKEEEKPQLKSSAQKERKPMPTKKVVKSQGVRSNIREYILAARKLKENIKDMSEFQKLDVWVEAKSPVKTPRKSSMLLKEVLTCEAEKTGSHARKTPSRNVSGNGKRKSSFSGIEIMAATNLAKCVKSGKTPLKNIMNEQTPGVSDARTPLKSILKQNVVSLSASERRVQFRFSGSKITAAKCLNDEFFPSVGDEYDSFMSVKMCEFALASPQSSKNKRLTSTPIRKSPRLAAK